MGGQHKWLFAFVDLLMALVAILAVAVFALASSVNPPAKDAPDMPPPGSIAVLMTWPQGDTDLDLWVDGPGQKVATGYSNKSGLVWSLLRDDLGNAGDTTPSNAESAFARATPAGEYTINVHAYNAAGEETVHVEVSLNGSLLVNTDMVLRPKQERTVIRFRLDENGHVVPGSANEVYRPLRSAKK